MTLRQYDPVRMDGRNYWLTNLH